MPMPTRGGGACAFEAEVDPADIPATRNGPLLSLRADEAQLCGPGLSRNGNFWAEKP